MAEFKHKKPSIGGSSDNDDLVDFGQSGAHYRPDTSGADNMLDDIDKVLADNEKAVGNLPGADQGGDVADRERNPQEAKKALTDTAAGKAAVDAASTAASTTLSPVAGAAVKLLAKVGRKKGATAFVVSSVLVMAIALMGLFSVSVAPVAFFTTVVDDLNDQLAALDIRGEKIIAGKLTKTEAEKSLKGCKVMSIKCKFKSMSGDDVERFKRAGIDVEGKKILGRTFPDKFNVKDKGYTPKEFASALKTDPVLLGTYRTALNMRALGFMDKIYVGKVMDRFKISKAAPDLEEGTVDEEYKKLATGTTETPLDPNTKFTEVTDADGNKMYVAEGDPSGRLYTAAEVKAIQSPTSSGMLDMFKNVASLTSENLAKSFEITGLADMYCSLRQTIGYAAIVAKISKYAKLAEYVAPIAASVYKIKAGDGTQHDGQVLGKFFGDPDTRKLITDDATTVMNGATNNDFTAQTKDNPYYNKNAMDSPLYKLSAYGGMADIRSAGTAKYSLSLSTNMIASILSGIAGFLSLGGLASTHNCQLVQNWLVRGGSLILGLLSLFTPAGWANLGDNLVQAVTITIAFIVLAQFLSAIVSGQVVPDNITALPEERSAATWTGLTALTGETARMSGMIPGNADQIVKYGGDTKASLAVYNKLDTQSVKPWDTSSPYSTASRLAFALQQYKPSNLLLGSVTSSIGSIIHGAITKPFSTSASAAEYKTERFKQCDDQEYNDLGLDADVQCNLRYIMPEQDLQMDPSVVAQWMEDHGFVEPDTTTGLPPGYTPPSSEEMNIGEELLSGAINSIYTTRDYVNDYGKFLDFCVYRAMPFGATYEETSAFGSPSEEWKNGKACLGNDYQTRAFRIYTMDNRVIDVSTPGQPAGSQTAPAAAAPPATSKNGWQWPLAGKSKADVSRFWKEPTPKGLHKGIDVGVPIGTKVYAAHDGVFSSKSYDSPTCGRMLLIQTTGLPAGSTPLWQGYQHLEKNGPLPKALTGVTAGQQIGTVGSYGGTTCGSSGFYHLHFSIELTNYISTYADSISLSTDPLGYLP